MGDISQMGNNKHKLRRGQMSGKVGAVLPNSVKLAPTDGKPVIEQLREILNANAVRGPHCSRTPWKWRRSRRP